MSESHHSDSPKSVHPKRSPAFVVAALSTMASLLSLILWSTQDACFRTAAWMANVNVGLTPFHPDSETADELGLTDMIIDSVTQWDSLGKRILAIYALTFVAAIGTAVAATSAIRRRTRKTIATVIGIAMCWIVMFTVRSPTHQWVVERQAAELLPQFESAAADLTANWPTKRMVIGSGVEVIVDPERYPDVLVVTNATGYSVTNGFGHTIDRSKHGVIRFSLSPAYEYNIEFHPNQSKPRAFVTGFGNPSGNVASYTVLKPHWYLVCYGGS